MTPERWRRLDELFHAAIEHGHGDRATLFAEVGEDGALRDELSRLLDEHDSADDFMRPPIDDRADHDAFVHAGRRIGAYRLVRVIAAGGMGVVYEAEQDHPRRAVAVKVMRGGFASQSARRRFQYEAEVLGRLRHPGVAQIYEAGAHDEGVLSIPYFAMEYLPGATTIIEHAAANELTLRQKLELFARVCDAVHHGHQQGVIHRDLKPGNILVDAGGDPKIIDFGVARTLDDGLPTTSLTDAGQLIGTLQYMSPEQLRGDPAEVDTRTDVYALGVVLFELLAGRKPRELPDRNVAGAIRAVETVPIPALHTVDARLYGDLSTIVGTALEIEKGRRYQAVSDIATDIRRYLRNEPIAARPPGKMYQLRKFAVRNRALVAASLVALLSLIVGVVVSVSQVVRARAERDRAQLHARRSELINKFLHGVFAAADPKKTISDLSIRAALDQAAEGIESELAGDPVVAADVHETMGQIYARLGQRRTADRHLRAALAARESIHGPNSLEVAATISSMVWSVCSDDPGEPEALWMRALEIHRSHYGDDSAQAATTKVYLACAKNTRSDFVGAERLLREALVTLRRIKNGPLAEMAFGVKHLGVSLQGQKRFDQAEACFIEALQIQRALPEKDSVEIAITLKNYAKLLREMGRSVDAESADREASEILNPRMPPP